MRRITLLAPLLVSIIVAPAWAQFGNPGFMAPGSADAPNTAPALTNSSDRLFARLAASGGNGEVDLARLAQKKTGSQGVRAFADRMIADHGQSNARLAAILRQAAIPAPRMPQPDQAVALRDLEQAEKGVFDVLYMRVQVADHAKMAQLLTWEINSGQNAELQRFASNTLPTVLEHLSMARDLLLQTEPAALPVGVNAGRASRGN
jgi:putative membrane protein